MSGVCCMLFVVWLLLCVGRCVCVFVCCVLSVVRV